MEKQLSKFAKRLKEARKAAGYSQKKLAEKADVGYSTLCRYERETRNNVFPRPLNLLHLAQVLDVTPEFLLEGKDDMNLYMDDLTGELEALNDDDIRRYHDMDMTDKVLAHLKLTEDFIRDVQASWSNGASRAPYTRPYVMEVIIKYASNRPAKRV